MAIFLNKIILNYFFTPIFLLIILIGILFQPTIFNNGSVVNLDKEIKSTFFNDKNDKNENLMVFFGYVGCVDICTPRLKEISEIYNDLKDKMNIDFYFINLTDSVSSDIADIYVKNFNENFKGIQLSKVDLEKLKSDFNVFSIKSLINENELEHTSFLFYLKKENNVYRIKKIFTASILDKTFVRNEILGL
jgi:protein SCO1/2